MCPPSGAAGQRTAFRRRSGGQLSRQAAIYGDAALLTSRAAAVQTGDHVIVETAGLEYAQCTQGNHPVDDCCVIQPLRPMVRVATENDRRTAAHNRAREKEAFDICQKKILQHKLEMKLVRVECSFEGNKTMFFFTADGRVDFRELVKDLASVFRARIELRQLGVRDEAKMLGGWASAAGPSAAPSSWTTLCRCPSKWPRPRACP